MGYARRNGSGNSTAKMAQRQKSYAHTGLSIRCASGHHSYPKSRGKRNPTGATGHAPKEWGRRHRKEEEHMSNLAARAEEDAILEGLHEMEDDWRDYDYDDDIYAGTAWEPDE